MRKLIAFVAAVLLINLSLNAQGNPSLQERWKQATEETKSLLVSRLNLAPEAASKITSIEADFAKRLADIEAATWPKLVDKEVKLNEAHVARRADLTKVPLTGRQMEDVITLCEQVRRKHKL